jgi:hypothetical protein
MPVRPASAPNRILVQDGVYDAFTDPTCAIISRTSSLDLPISAACNVGSMTPVTLDATLS